MSMLFAVQLDVQSVKQKVVDFGALRVGDREKRIVTIANNSLAPLDFKLTLNAQSPVLQEALAKTTPTLPGAEIAAALAGPTGGGATATGLPTATANAAAANASPGALTTATLQSIAKPKGRLTKGDKEPVFSMRPTPNELLSLSPGEQKKIELSLAPSTRIPQFTEEVSSLFRVYCTHHILYVYFYSLCSYAFRSALSTTGT